MVSRGGFDSRLLGVSDGQDFIVRLKRILYAAQAVGAMEPYLVEPILWPARLVLHHWRVVEPYDHRLPAPLLSVEAFWGNSGGRLIGCYFNSFFLYFTTGRDQLNCSDCCGATFSPSLMKAPPPESSESDRQRSVSHQCNMRLWSAFCTRSFCSDSIGTAWQGYFTHLSMGVDLMAVWLVF